MLRALTLNLNFDLDGKGRWPDRRAVIGEALSRLRPDVVALQAVRRAAGEADQAAQVARAAGFSAAAFVPVSGNGDADGMAVLSRWPILATRAHPLPASRSADDPSPRALVEARMSVDGRAWTLFNGHFSWVPEVNAANVAAAASLIAAARGPALLMGDFNAPPDAPSLAPLRAAAWTDAWARLKPNDPGPTFESDRLFTRIDYVWTNPEAASLLTRVDRVDPGGPPFMSDHLGLVASFDDGRGGP